MMRSKLSPREIVQRLQTIEGLAAEGFPVAEALRTVGVLQVEYDRWRSRVQRLAAHARAVAVRDAEASEENAPHDCRSSTQAARVAPLRESAAVIIVGGESDMRWWPGRRSTALRSARAITGQ